MKWTEAKDIILCKEVALQNPFQFRRGSLERGKVWSGVATELRKQSFKVDQRAVRDRYNSLKNKVQKNNSQDKRASGISPEETESQRELRVLLEDLANQEDDAELLPKTNASERSRGASMDKRSRRGPVNRLWRQGRGERLILPQMGLVGWHFADKENMPRKRNSGSDALQFLHQKMELEREMRKEELAMRRAEVKRDEAERDRRFELFQQQQQQTQQQFMQQQQQMQQHLAQQQQQMQNMLMMFMQSMKGNNKQ
ncbi:putative PERQ amino acid-rich with GYF domain-containing protein 2-like [Apostichopus japonicus]|uniref:Putative PERQ amino acid-rich with GYF domain-containing protein 2-like n=1 Tax=Stichopus japonicus TaxID=307972 RepID=A0A2G8KCC9_STIJA|nr:putative PERQ amino acid-rich with GYF domain-containing protein 2-like [Apostichopus japonicus]